jgi:hypothetical protein
MALLGGTVSTQRFLELVILDSCGEHCEHEQQWQQPDNDSNRPACV